MILPAARVLTSDKIGSGFVIGSTENGTFILTNHHVIKSHIQQTDIWNPVEQSSKKVDRFLPVSVELFRYDERGRHTQTITTSAEIVSYSQFGDQWDFQGDMALLKLKAPVDDLAGANLIAEEDFLSEVRLLDEVVMVGCPDGSAMPMPLTGHVASMTEERAGVGLLLSQLFGNLGSSGSAVYRYSVDRGVYEVIAIHSMTDGRGSLTDKGHGNFLRLAIPAPSILDFLNRIGYGHLVAPESPADCDDKAEGELPPSAKADDEAAPIGNSSEHIASNQTDTTDPSGVDASDDADDKKSSEKDVDSDEDGADDDKHAGGSDGGNRGTDGSSSDDTDTDGGSGDGGNSDK